jgi:putative tricarboxylic transport membrane protein
MAELSDGFGLLPVLIGLFAVGQLVVDILHIDETPEPVDVSRRGLLFRWRDWKTHGVNLLRSSFIGTWIGILPGVGANVGSVMAYSAARSASEHPEEFGKGSEEGVIASEAANNATVGGALIPLVALGIPGSVIDAILLGALVVHGLQPGPLLFERNPEAVYTIMTTLLLANCLMYGFLVTGVAFVARLMYVPKAFLVPVVMTFCVVGSYALSNRIFDIWVMLAFAGVGLAMRAGRVPLAPFVIGFVLAPVAEENLSAGLQISGGSYAPLVTRPLSLLFLLVALFPLTRRILRARKRRSA